MPGRQLTLLLPGLFGPETDPDIKGDPTTSAREAGVLATGLDLPHLVRVLSRARAVSSNWIGPSLEALYFKSFELSTPADADLPVAALTAAIDGLDTSEGIWLRADPVHLRPDLARLILRDSRDLDIQADEARQLADELNNELQEFDLELLVANPARWYLRLATLPDFTSISPASAHGRDADSSLLKGDSDRYWHQLQNQIQMLLHQSPVNTAREERGHPPINSLWFWGVGAKPDQPARTWGQVCGDDPLLGALAEYTESPYTDLPAGADPWLSAAPLSDCLVVMQSAARAVHAQDRNAWQDAIDIYENDWFAPLLKALAERQLGTLTVDGGSGCKFVLSARDARKWWRRDRPLRALFSTARATSL